MKAESEQDILLQRFDKEPVVLFDATQAEIIKGMSYIMIALGLVGGAALYPFLHNILYGVSAGFVFGMAAFIMFFKWLQIYRKDRITGYLSQSMNKKLASFRVGKVIYRSGAWMVGKQL